MAKKIIDISGTATQMLNDINSNFDELYQGEGGGSGSSISGLPTKHVKVYDVMTRGGQGFGSPVIVSCNIKKSTKYIIEKAEVGTNWDYEIVTTYSNGSSVQEMLRTQGGTTSKGGYDIEIEATADADTFRIDSYYTGVISIYHYEDVPDLGNRWLGKRWLLLGDSISTEHGTYAQVGYGELVANTLGMYRSNRAVSGETSAQQCARVSGYGNNYDLITAMVGTNDQGYNVSLGTLSDTPSQDGSFFARMKYFYETLRTKYPKSVIAFITPIKRDDNGDGQEQKNALNLTTEAYANAVQSVADYYSIPCLDLYNAINPLDSTARANFFCDGVGLHPNDLGHALFLAPRVEAFLREIAPFYFNDWT